MTDIKHLADVSPSENPDSPKQRRTRPHRTAQTRLQIITAAADTFGQLGFAQTRVEDILSRASVSRPTFYRFFKSKDDVFDALDEMSSTSLVHMVSSAVSNERDPILKISAGVEAFLRWLAATGPLAAVLVQESTRPESRLAPRRETTHRILVDLFSNEAEKARGVRYDPILISTLVGAIEYVGNALMRETPKLTEKQIQRGKRIVLRVVYATLVEQEGPLPPIPVAGE